jgi:hypothetical protein
MKSFEMMRYMAKTGDWKVKVPLNGLCKRFPKTEWLVYDLGSIKTLSSRSRCCNTAFANIFWPVAQTFAQIVRKAAALSQEGEPALKFSEFGHFRHICTTGEGSGDGGFGRTIITGTFERGP